MRLIPFHVKGLSLAFMRIDGTCYLLETQKMHNLTWKKKKTKKENNLLIIFLVWHPFVLVQIKVLVYDITFCLSLLRNTCFKRQFSECQTAYATTGTLHLQLKSNLSIYHSVTAPKTFLLGLFKIIFRDKYVIKLSGQ